MADSAYRQKKNRLERAIKLPDELIQSIEKVIEETIRENRMLSNQYHLLTSITGVGPQVAIKMIIETNGFKDFANGRKFCIHAGVAPSELTSGSSLVGS